MTLPPDDRWPRAGAFLGLALAVTSIRCCHDTHLNVASHGYRGKIGHTASLLLRRANRPSAAAEWGP
jgi:hypothetical protein